MQTISHALLAQVSGGCDEIGFIDDGFCHPPALPEPIEPVVPPVCRPRLSETNEGSYRIP